MIVRPVHVRSLRARNRLDCKYYLSPGTQASERLAVVANRGTQLRRIGKVNGLGRVWAPGRFRRVYAATGERAAPYLRPYDVFDYVPQPADMLSVVRSSNLPQLKAPAGALLLTCSGRNLGPAVAVDTYLERFALSHDLIRVEIPDEVDRYFALAFLNTPTGQALIRRDKTGSVIDHISVDHVDEVQVPMIDERLRRDAADLMRDAVKTRERSRLALDKVVQSLAATLPPVKRAAAAKTGWQVRRNVLTRRLDAAFHDPQIAELRRSLLELGGQTLGTVAEVKKPAGRYRTYYVDSLHGRPLLSGRQVLQHAPIHLQFIASRALDPKRYELGSCQTVFQADGRSEERLGYPALLEPGRDHWLASGHVGRLTAHDGVDPGWLWAAFATEHVQFQVKALACGSVVDALYVEDLREVVLPPPGVDCRDVVPAWSDFTTADVAQVQATSLIEDEISRLAGERQTES